MDCSKDKIYFLIESLRRCDMKATEIHAIVTRSWPEQSLSLRHIQKLCKEFRDGERESFDRAQGSGRRKSDTRTENIDNVKALIEADNSKTVQSIADALGLTHTMVQRIMTEDLDKAWIHTKWVPHHLTEGNKAVRVDRCTDLIDALASRICQSNLVTIDEKWFYCRKLIPCNKIGSWVTAGGDEEPIQTPRRTTMEKKFMAIVAVTQKGHHFYKLLPRNTSIDSESYIEFLASLEVFLRNLPNPIQPENMRLIHDNARPHVSRATMAAIQAKNIRLLKQPPYSPDCNLCDRYIFPRLESARVGNFENLNDIAAFLDQELPKFTPARMAKALSSMVDDLETIVNNGGEYI